MDTTMFKNIILILLLTYIPSITLSQVVLMNDNPKDTVYEARERQIISLLKYAFETNNHQLGHDSVENILNKTRYYTIPLYQIADLKKHITNGHNGLIKVKKRLRSMISIDYNPDTLHLKPHVNRIAWVFMIYEDYLLGYYHFSSQNSAKNGDFKVIQYIDNPNLKLGLYEFRINDDAFLQQCINSFSIFGYLKSDCFYQDAVILTHSQYRIVKQTFFYDLF